MTRTQAVLAPALLALAAGVVSAQSLVELEVIATEDRAVNGMPGFHWERLEIPFIDGFGEVAFASEINDGGRAFDAVFKTDDAGLMSVIADGDPSPGVLFGTLDVDRNSAFLTSDGRMVLRTFLVTDPVSGVDTTNDFVFYEWENGNFTLRFRENQFISGPYFTPANRTPPLQGSPSPGVFTFSESFNQISGPGFVPRFGVWYYDNGTLSPVALRDDPGVDLFFPGRDFQTFTPSDVNDSGVVAFGGGDSNSSNQNVYRWQNGAFETVARSYDSVPGAPAFLFNTFFGVDINNEDDVVFASQFRFFNAGIANVFGLFRDRDGVVESIAVEDQPAPGFPAGALYEQLFFFNSVEKAAQNDAGDILFDFVVNVPGSGMLNGAYFLHRDGVTTPIARLRQALPGGGEIEFFINDPILLDNGDAVFIINNSLYAYRDATQQLESVLLIGDTIDVSSPFEPTATRTINRVARVDIEQNPLSPEGRGTFVAYVSLPNNTDAIVRGRLVNKACPADIDFDGDVDLGDFGIFGAVFGRNDCDPSINPCLADFDGDGDVDLGDFGVFGAQFGTLCP